MLNGIEWNLVQKMLIDAPSYDDIKSNNSDDIELTEDNAEEVLSMIMGMVQ